MPWASIIYIEKFHATELLRVLQNHCPPGALPLFIAEQTFENIFNIDHDSV